MRGQAALSSRELFRRWTLDVALWSEVRTGAQGGAGEVDRGVRAEAVGSGPVTAGLCHWLQESYQCLSLEYSVFLVILPRGHGSADKLCCPQ